MRTLYTAVIIILLLPLFAPPAKSQSFLELDHATTKIDASDYLRFVEDPSGQLSVEQVFALPESAFQTLDSKQFNGGYSESAYWLKLTLFYNLPQDRVESSHDWILEIDYAALDYIDLYYQAYDSLLGLSSGDRRPQSVRRNPGNYHAFYLRFPPNQPQDVYLRVQTSSSLQIPVSIWAPAEIFSARTLTRLGYGMYFGLLLVMAVYNLMLYFSLSEKAYIYYVLYIGAFAFLQSSIAGLSSQYLWPQAPSWANTAIPFFIGTSSLFAIQFSREFLQTYKHSFKTDRILLAVGAASVVVILLSFVASYQIALAAGNALTLLISATLIWTGIVATRKSIPGAQFFLMGWTCLLLGSFIFMLVSTGLLPPNLFTENAALYGSALEALLLALALGDRIKAVRQQKDLIAEQARENLRAGNKELSLSLAQLEHNDALKDEFLAKVSHELRTPLNGILGSLELMQLESLKPEVAEYAESANTSAEHMLELVNTLLDFSESKGSSSINTFDLVNVHALGESLKRLYISDMREKNLLFNLQIHPEVPQLLYADEGKLKLILSQLIDNALKYSSHGKISLEIRPSKLSIQTTRLMFRLQDCGPGIPEAQLDSVFDPFVQSDDTAPQGGMGMGLAICRQLVTRMKGWIKAEACDSGALLVMELPFSLPKDSR